MLALAIIAVLLLALIALCLGALVTAVRTIAEAIEDSRD